MLPQQSSNDARVKAQTETEVPGAWIFRVRIEPAGDNGAGLASEHDVRLSWVDYEYWSHGAISPSRIVELVVTALIDARPELALPEKFDAATARRWARELDERMRETV